GDVVVDIQNINKDGNVFEIDSLTALNEPPSWGSLPAICRPFIQRLCFHLRNEEDCADLGNLAKISTHFRTGVKEFMNNNRPGVYSVDLRKTDERISVEMSLYPSNIPFYELPNLNEWRFLRWRGSAYPKMTATLNALETNVANQVSGLLSTHIKNLRIFGEGLAPSDFLLCSQLLSKSTSD
ncbi:hypothetical protein PMAYCL1PPCAC_22392, partial [Pristionchus mayeri]